MEQSVKKTIICSVFFLDIVEYSKRSVSGQISLKERFNAFLSEAIAHVPANDRIILDTGDGAAVSFLGDIEDALRAALSMRESLQSAEGTREPALLVRMGVNLGPVRVVRDINGQPNIVGDGINVAQRVMGFAGAGQILVSRSYFDAASRLSPVYAGMFHYQGSRTDKHVREHEVYAIGYPGDQVDELGEQSATHSLKNAALMGKINFTMQATRARSVQYFNRYAAVFSQLSAPKKYSLIAGAAIPLLSVLMLGLLGGLKKEDTKPLALTAAPAVPIQNIAHSAVQTQQVASTVLAANQATVATAAHTKSHPPIQKEKTVSVVPKIKPAPVNHPAQAKIANPDTDSARDAANQAPATLNLAIQPWGEVYLDGRMIDVSPPLNQLKVTAGRHLVEIRNTTFPVFKQTIEVKAGEKISIRHKFAN